MLVLEKEDAMATIMCDYLPDSQMKGVFGGADPA